MGARFNPSPRNSHWTPAAVHRWHGEVREHLIYNLSVTGLLPVFWRLLFGLDIACILTSVSRGLLGVDRAPTKLVSYYPMACWSDGSIEAQGFRFESCRYLEIETALWGLWGVLKFFDPPQRNSHAIIVAPHFQSLGWSDLHTNGLQLRALAMHNKRLWNMGKPTQACLIYAGKVETTLLHNLKRKSQKRQDLSLLLLISRSFLH